MGSLLFFPHGPGAHKSLCEPSKSGVSVSPSPVEVLWSNTAGFQSQILWGLLLPLLDLQAEKPEVGSELSLLYNCFPVCGLPTQWVWDLILLWLSPSYNLIVASSLSLGVGYLFFGGFQWVFFVDGCSTVSCDFGVFIRRGWAHVLLLHHLELRQSPT